MVFVLWHYFVLQPCWQLLLLVTTLYSAQRRDLMDYVVQTATKLRFCRVPSIASWHNGASRLLPMVD